MANPKHLTAVERKKRREIRVLIHDAKKGAHSWRAVSKFWTADLLDDLAGVAEEYLEVMKHGDNSKSAQ